MGKKGIIILIFSLLIIAGTTFFFIVKDKIFKDNDNKPSEPSETSTPEPPETKPTYNDILFTIERANKEPITYSKIWKLQMFHHGVSKSGGIIANSFQKTNGNNGDFFNKSGYNIQIIEKINEYEYKVNLFVGEGKTKLNLCWVKYTYNTVKNNNHPANAYGYIGTNINSLSNVETTFILKFLTQSICVLKIGKYLIKNSETESEEIEDEGFEDAGKYIGITDWGIDLFNHGKLIHNNKGPPDSTHTSSREQQFTDISDPYWIKTVDNPDDAMQIKLMRVNRNINNINGYTTGDVISARNMSHKIFRHEIVSNL